MAGKECADGAICLFLPMPYQGLQIKKDALYRRPRSIYYAKGRQKKKIVQRDMTSIPIYPLVVGICLYTLIVLFFSLKRLYDKGAY